jgi:hypothetical protein
MENAFMRFLRKPARPRAPLSGRAFLQVEVLETRVVPYVTTGNSWPNHQLVTISFVPDGTILGSNGNGYITSNLFATFNAKFGSASVWENQILKAAQVWAQQTNINFAVVPDNGTPLGQGAYQQGDPTLGDIRIGGYNFGTRTLASADLPPPGNNYSIAGDIQFNTGQSFNIGATYDLFTVAAHEFGHALGLGESLNPLAVMWPIYLGARSGLGSDDTSGIRSIYSNGNPRTPDPYNTGPSANTSFATAATITPLIDPTALTAVVNNVNIASTSDVEYYTFTAPAGSASSMTIRVQSSGLSLLDPKLTVYAADQTTVLGTATGSGEQGNTLTVTVSGISAGQQFYIKVAGATSTSFGTGACALTLNLGTGPAPTVPLPNTQLLDGNPIHGTGGLPQDSGDGDDNGGPGQAGLPLPGGSAPTPSPSPLAAAPPVGVGAALQAPGQQTAQPLRSSVAGLPPLPAVVDAAFSARRAASGVPSPVVPDGPAAAPVLPPHATNAAPESGGGDAGVPSGGAEQPEQAAVVPDTVQPADSGRPAALAAPATPAGRAVSFTDWSWVAAPVADGASSERARETATGTLDSTAAAAGLAILFSWGAQPADQDEERGRVAE